MDEPKGGPVKPPTLDLKPIKSSRVKPGGVYAGATKKVEATPKARASSSANVSSAPNANSKPSTKRAEAQDTKPGSKNASPHVQTRAATSDIPVIEDTKGAPDYLAVIAGAIGGALLALLILVPLLLLGVFQSGNQQQIDDLIARVGLSEEQTREGLVGYNALNARVNLLSDQFTDEIEKMGTIQTSLEVQQNDLEQKGNAIIARQDELLAQINVLQSIPQIEFDPATLSEEIRMLNQRIDAIDAGASSSDAERFATDLAQIHNEIGALETKLFEQLEGDLILKVQDLIDENSSNLQADILASAGQIGANQSQLDDMSTRVVDNSALLVELDTRLQTPNLQTPNLPGGTTFSDSSFLIQAPGLALALERTVTSGERFDQQLEAYLLNFPDMGVSDELMVRSRGGLNTQQELIEAFNSALPKMLAARPGAPDANWLERFGNSIKSLFAIRTTGERAGEQEGNAVDNSLNQLQGALSEGHYEHAWYWLGQLPEPMQVALADTGVQISLLREVGVLLEITFDDTLAIELVPLTNDISLVETISPEPDNSGGIQ